MSTGDGFLVIAKAADLSARSRGEEWENLPFGFYAGPGPSAWRESPDVIPRRTAAMLEARGRKKLTREQRKNWLERLLTRDRTEEAMNDIYLARQMRER